MKVGIAARVTLAVAGGLLLVACAVPVATTTQARSAVSTPASSRVAAARTDAAQITVPTTTPTAVPAESTTAPSPSGPPHFATPDDAMRYLAAAYDNGDETAIRHVTTPDSRDQFEAERQWVRTFAFRDCTANGAPDWDYTCVLDIVARMPGVPDPATDPSLDPASVQAMNEVTVLAAPAAAPGWYLEANEGCGGG